MGSILENETFQQLVDGSIVRGRPFEALKREFFIGRIEMKDDDMNYETVYDCAFTTREMEFRKNSGEFCLLCFRGEQLHYYDCPKSPWHSDNWDQRNS